MHDDAAEIARQASAIGQLEKWEDEGGATARVRVDFSVSGNLRASQPPAAYRPALAATMRRNRPRH